MLGGLVKVPQLVVKAANETEGVRVQRRRSVSNTCKKQGRKFQLPQPSSSQCRPL